MTTQPESNEKTKRVVVVGAGISGLTTAWKLQSQGLEDTEVVVFERGSSPGGTARSETHNGYTVDLGPNGFLSNVPDTVELAHAVGVGDQLREADPSAKLRYLFWDGALHPLPFSPPALVQTKLLSTRAKLRLLGEVFSPKPKDPGRESVFDFAQRHFGREFAERFMATMVLGITSGDARKTSLSALFPRMRTLEDNHRSLILAGLHAQFVARSEKNAAQSLEKAARVGSGRLTSFRNGGMQVLSDALAAQLGPSLRLSCAVRAIEPKSSGGYAVHLEHDDDPVHADSVVLAVPARVATRWVQGWGDAGLGGILGSIEMASVDVTSLGYAREELGRDLKGFGFLVPRGQGVRILGSQWTSSLYPEQTPEGRVFFRVMTGGSADPSFVHLPDDEALWQVRCDLSRVLGITARPEFVHRTRWTDAIPQYGLDHLATMRHMKGALGRYNGLFLTGNSYFGVGYNDAIRDAGRVATLCAQHIRSTT